LFRLLGWWSIDEGSREEQARLYFDQESGYNTFSGHPPEIVKKMPKEDLAEEVTLPLWHFFVSQFSADINFRFSLLLNLVSSSFSIA